jgi:alpha-mannosidase
MDADDFRCLMLNVDPFRNVFPHSTFNWVGIDGTQVLCHMTPVGKFQVYLPSFPSHHHQTLTPRKLLLGTSIRESPTTRSVSQDMPYVSWHSDVLKNLESSDTALLVFGNGDGGGGPLAKMLENVSVITCWTRLKRFHGFADGFE